METKILFHTVEYWYESHEDEELTESCEEHIRYMINEGYSSGQLWIENDEGDEMGGWWQIVGYESQTNPYEL